MALERRGAHGLWSHGQAGQHVGKDAQRVLQGVDRVEQGFLVLLVVLVVGQGLALHQRDQADQVAHDAARLAARQLRHVGVLLLRHDRRARAEGIGQRDEAEVLAHPQDQLLGQSRDVQHHERRSRRELDRKVTVADGVQAVLADALHAQRAGHALAVQRVAGAGQRGGAQRQAVHALAGVQQALSIPREHLHIRQQVVAEADRLCHLQVGEAGQDDLGVPLGLVHQHALKRRQQAVDLVDLAAQPEPHVGGHLVVAAAAGVQALAGDAHALGQASLDVEVNVLQVQLPVEPASLDLGGDLAQAALDGGMVFGAEDALRGQHLGVGQAAGDVRPPQALVEAHAGRVALDEIAHRLGEQGGPGVGFVGELVVGHGVSVGSRRAQCAAARHYRVPLSAHAPVLPQAPPARAPPQRLA
mmetsp:Transcript_69589/g.163584  ORF Transcript_69589/g.163584 Transcript_69589/m.163584 type:complete len:415 (-) Transcript_69589:1059-2303(-)